MYRILIIEDDMRIAEGIEERLCQWDYHVQIVHDFRNVMHDFTQYISHSLYYWILHCRFMMAITGAMKYAMYPVHRSSSSLPRQTA